MGRALVSDEDREALLEWHIEEALRHGGRVVSERPYAAEVVYGHPVNHILHLLITVFLFGLWLPVWLFVTLTGGEKRLTIWVNEYGAAKIRRV